MCPLYELSEAELKDEQMASSHPTLFSLCYNRLFIWEQLSHA